ncbi:MAG: hypothetical protein LBG11_07195 [Bifidobacteriaceae bacterium]|nr:hypothetical protein [Bifidobacteriaceae bacterium]
MSRIVRTSTLTRPQAACLVRHGYRLTRGLYLDAHPRDDREALLARAAAALATCPAGSMLTGITALALAGVDLPDSLVPARDQPVEVVVPHGGNFPKRCDIHTRRVRQLPPHWALSDLELPMTHPAYSWACLVLRLAGDRPWWPGQREIPRLPGTFSDPAKASFLAAVQVGDALLRRRYPLLAATDFRAQIAQLPSFNGCKTVRRWADQVRANTDSLNQTWLRLIVLDAGFPPPAINPLVSPVGCDCCPRLSWPGRRIWLEYRGHPGRREPNRVNRVRTNPTRADLTPANQSRAETHRQSRPAPAAGWRLVEAAYSDLARPANLLGSLAALGHGAANGTGGARPQPFR